MGQKQCETFSPNELSSAARRKGSLIAHVKNKYSVNSAYLHSLVAADRILRNYKK